MGRNFEALSQFDEGWVKVYTYLLETYGPWKNFCVSSPTGPHRKIVELDTGQLFITAAKRALENKRVFYVSPFAELCAEAVIKAQGVDVKLLPKKHYNRVFRREYKSLNDTMKCLNYFGLFDENGRARYTITKQGERCYEYMEKDNPEDFDLRCNDEHSRRGSGANAPRRGNSPVMLHAPEK